MKLVIGCPIKDRAWCLPAWFHALESQCIEHETIFVYTDSADNTLEILTTHQPFALLRDDRDGRPVNEIDGHAWGAVKWYEYLSDLRNQLVTTALNMNADYFFSLDSDILLPPGGLQKMLDYAQTHQGVISPAVNMSEHDTAWNTMSWIDPYHPAMATRPVKYPKGGQVDIVMAAMLLDRKGLEAEWVSHTQGEDVGFSLDARRKEIPLWWMSNLHCQHVMRHY
jgi:hypothetical protein